MQPNRRWQMALFVRVVANIFGGALLMAGAGMLCGLVTGELSDWLANSANAVVGIPFSPADRSPFLSSSVATGAIMGFLIGAFIFAVAAVRAQPGPTFEPVRALAGRVALGLVAGTLGVCSLFLVVEFARASLSSQSFYVVAMQDLTLLFVGVLALMICGAIAGALSKRNA